MKILKILHKDLSAFMLLTGVRNIL